MVDPVARLELLDDDVREVCARDGPEIAYEVDHIDSMLGLVAAGLGVSFAPRSAERLCPEEVRLVPLIPRIRATVHLVWLRRATSPVVERFVRVLDSSPTPDPS